MISVFTTATFLPEKEYVLHVLLRVLLETDFRLRVAEKTDPAAAVQPVTRFLLPNGACIEIEDHFFSRHTPENYAHVDNIPTEAPSVAHPFHAESVLTVIFGRPHYIFGEQKAVCGIDLLAGSFFMLSRWEEYAHPARDAHGRFPAAASLAVRAGFLERPVVNEYAALMADFFRHLGFEVPTPRRQFRVLYTHDVDHPRLWYRTTDRLRTLAGAALRRRAAGEFIWWLKGPVWQEQDPYDTFDLLMRLSEEEGHPGCFNFLGVRPPSSDCYYPLDHPFVRRLIQEVEARGHLIGFHPSYESFDQPALFVPERDSLQRFCRQPVQSGRQHYLRFSAPHTWQQWADAGMAWDSTAGYSEAEGFRCGVCVAFPVFQFLSRRMLTLSERPLIAMDVTLALYRRYTPQQATERLQQLRREVEKHAGEFVLLWHNSSLSGPFWSEWATVLTQ